MLKFTAMILTFLELQNSIYYAWISRCYFLSLKIKCNLLKKFILHKILLGGYYESPWKKTNMYSMLKEGKLSTTHLGANTIINKSHYIFLYIYTHVMYFMVFQFPYVSSLSNLAYNNISNGKTTVLVTWWDWCESWFKSEVKTLCSRHRLLPWPSLLLPC